MPTGKVKWYDAEKGFGFLSQEDGPGRLRPLRRPARGADHAQGRHPRRVRHRAGPPRRPGAPGAGARPARLGLRNQSHAKRRKPDEMAPIVEDLIRLLDERGRVLPPRPAPRRPHRQAHREAAARAGRRARGSDRPTDAGPAGSVGRDRRPGRTGCERRPVAGRVSSTKTVQATSTARPPPGRAGGSAASRCPRTRRPPRPAAAWCRCGRRRWPAPRAARRPGSWSPARPCPATGRARRPGRAAKIVGDAVEQRAPSSDADGVGDQDADHRRRGVDAAQQRGRHDAERVAEPGAADDQAEQQLGAVLPAGDRVLAQQERHEHDQEPGQPARAAVGAQRERHRRRDAGGRAGRPGSSCGSAVVAAAISERSLARPRRRPGRAAGWRARWRPRRARRRSAAPTGRRGGGQPATGADTAAPTTPASETRPLALTRVSDAGSRRGTAAARVTP